MTLTNVVWLLAGWVAARAWWRRPRHRCDNDRDRGEPMVRVRDLPEIRRGLRVDIERARRDNGGDAA